MAAPVADINFLVPLVTDIENYSYNRPLAQAWTVDRIQNDIDEAFYHYRYTEGMWIHNREQWFIGLEARAPPAREGYDQEKMLSFLWDRAMVERNADTFAVHVHSVKHTWIFRAQPLVKYSQIRNSSNQAHQQLAQRPDGCIIPNPILPALFPPHVMTWATQPSRLYQLSINCLLAYGGHWLEFHNMKDVYMFLRHLESLNPRIPPANANPAPTLAELPPTDDYRNSLEYFVIQHPFSAFAGYAIDQLTKTLSVESVMLKYCETCQEARQHRNPVVRKRSQHAKRDWADLNRLSGLAVFNNPPAFWAETVRFEQASRRVGMTSICEACSDVVRRAQKKNRNMYLSGRPNRHPQLDMAARKELVRIGRQIVGRPNDRARVRIRPGADGDNST